MRRETQQTGESEIKIEMQIKNGPRPQEDLGPDRKKNSQVDLTSSYLPINSIGSGQEPRSDHSNKTDHRVGNESRMIEERDLLG